MKLTPFLTSAAMVAALAIAAPPAHADQNRGSHARHAANRTPQSSRRTSGGRARTGAAVRRAPSSAPRAQQSRPAAPSPSVRRAVPRTAVPRSVAPYRSDSRYRNDSQYRRRQYERRGRTTVIVPRPYRYRSYSYAYRPYRAYAYRPYYSFRPRLRIAFGLYIGYPVAYPYAIYPAPAPVYGYTVAPDAVVAPTAYGGVSLDIGPADADVFVDGTYVGRAGDFGPGLQPLTMTPGRHRVEVTAPGYLTMTFDVDVMPGQVIPYQGTLQPY